MRRTTILALLFLCCATISFGQAAQQTQTTGNVPPQDLVYEEHEVDIKAKLKDEPKGNVRTKRSDNSFLPFTNACPAQGVTTVRIIVNKTGKVTEAKVLKGSECSSFDKKMAEDARKIKFIPAVKDGIAVSQATEVAFSYFWPRGRR